MPSPLDPEFFQLLSSSYHRYVGEHLTPRDLTPEAAAQWLYEQAPFAVLAHSNEADPVFVYGNRPALDRFGYTWEELTALRSRYSAEAPNREERQRLLDRVKNDGYAADYSGVRITKQGKRFMIQDATLWQLIDEHGQVRGQAVRILKTTDM